MATKEENNKEQEPQMCFKLNGSKNTIQIPVSKFHALLTQKLMKKMEDLKIGTKEGHEEFFKFLDLDSYEKKYKDLKRNADILKNITERLKEDLKHDKFAQPMRPNFETSQNLFIRKIAEKNKNVNQVITLSDEECEQPTKIEKKKPDLGSKTISIQTEDIN